MHLNPQTNPSTTRSINFIIARLLAVQPRSVGISICGPDDEAEEPAAQPPFGGVPAQNDNYNPPSGNSGAEPRPIVNRN